MSEKAKMGSSFLEYRSPSVASLERRLFLRQGLSLGALALLSGCDLTGAESAQKLLSAMSRWNDGAQDWLFDPRRLAPEFPESRITTPFPFNAYYSEDEVIEVDGAGYRLALAGLMLFWVAEDFLWFLVNPAFGWSHFDSAHVPWHKRWWWGAPVDYWGGLAGAALLLWWRSRSRPLSARTASGPASSGS